MRLELIWQALDEKGGLKIVTNVTQLFGIQINIAFNSKTVDVPSAKLKHIKSQQKEILAQNFKKILNRRFSQNKKKILNCSAAFLLVQQQNQLD